MAENCRECLHYTRNEEYDCPECLHRGVLMSDEEVDKHDNECRIWDAFIPLDATEEQIDYAKKWQDMPYKEQPDYYDYFGPNADLL